MSKHNHPVYKWAKAKGMLMHAIARQAGVTPETLSRYINGHKAAPQTTRLAFESVTGGDVKATDWPEDGK